ncbi:hypothetical protein [Bifidobacterium tissieri]|uniref:Type 2 lantibiotic n=1 Tax=Bifidobacterium tissieri TaxID=1630162 RepID=A0A5M9ZY21_9BIFI|nr:hypothetical protein [Bifidobacterium tissieri]KAA8831534.1 hypothetical protein EMO89_02045 [Bifidobacterium tissieri]KAA8832500.1 hypothetical protein EM849_04775 [Bifidobacterium tissieri]
MSNKDINTIVGDEFEDLDPANMALLTGRGSEEAAPASTPLTTVTPTLPESTGIVSATVSTASFVSVGGTIASKVMHC